MLQRRTQTLQNIVKPGRKNGWRAEIWGRFFPKSRDLGAERETEVFVVASGTLHLSGEFPQPNRPPAEKKGGRHGVPLDCFTPP